jgi:hypothetical protein
MHEMWPTDQLKKSAWCSARHRIVGSGHWVGTKGCVFQASGTKPKSLINAALQADQQSSPGRPPIRARNGACSHSLLLDESSSKMGRGWDTRSSCSDAFRICLPALESSRMIRAESPSWLLPASCSIGPKTEL